MTVQRNLLVAGFTIFLLSSVVCSVSLGDGINPRGRFSSFRMHFRKFCSTTIKYRPVLTPQVYRPDVFIPRIYIGLTFSYHVYRPIRIRQRTIECQKLILQESAVSEIDVFKNIISNMKSKFTNKLLQVHGLKSIFFTKFIGNSSILILIPWYSVTCFLLLHL